MIEDKIKKGIKNTYSDLELFTGEINNYDFPEYLLTVNIAKSVAEIKDCPIDPWIIKVEESTKKFARSCVPLLSTEDKGDEFGFAKMIISKIKNTKRNGNMDICIYENIQGINHSRYCIEVKRDSPSKKEILKDLKRMTELFDFQDRTGENCFKEAYLPFVVDITNIMDNKIKIKKVFNKYKGHLKSLNTANVCWELKVFYAAKFDKKNYNIPENDDYRDHFYKILGFYYKGKKK